MRPIATAARRATGFSLLLLLALPACGAGSVSTEFSTALQTATQMRERCVASTLDVLQRVADYVGPVVGARDLDGLQHVADATGCTLFGPTEGNYRMLCPGMLVRGESVTLSLTLTFLDDDGFPTVEVEGAAALLVRVDAGGGFLASEGQLMLTPDPDRGILLDGFLSTAYFDGCTLWATFEDVTARAVADLPGLAMGVIFTSGDVDIGAETPDGQAVTGSAGLVGRSAVVALELAGVQTQGEIQLGPQPLPTTP